MRTTHGLYTATTPIIRLLIPALLLNTGLCWSLPQDGYFRSPSNGEASYDLYVDFDGDYYDSGPQAQPQIDNPPVFVEAGQQYQVGEGDSVIFNCATIKPSSHVMIIKKLTKDGNEGQLFYVGDVKIHRDRRINLKDGLLNITLIKERDQGDYVCYFEGNPVIEVIHSLSVKSAPKILHHSDDASVTPGDVVSLECTAEGNPEPRIEWTRSEGPMPSGKRKEEGSVLRLDGTSKGITGTYICKAINELGMTSETVSVTYRTVEDKTVSDTFKDTQDQSIKIEKVITQTGWDSTLKLICTARIGLMSLFKWRKDGNVVEQDQITEDAGNGMRKSTISFPLLSSDEFGNYTCQVDSSTESLRSSIFVEDQPREAKFTSDPEGTGDTSYHLSWKSESNSPVIWYMVSIRKVLDDSSEPRNLGTFQNTELVSEDNVYTLSHELVDLTPDTEYEVFIQVNNKFRWSEASSFRFTTKRASSQMSDVSSTSKPTSSQESAVPVIPTQKSNQEAVVPTNHDNIQSKMSQPNSNLESVISRLSPVLDWCEPPLTTVGSECFFFSHVLGSDEDSGSKDTWNNAQKFCEDDGGDLAQPSAFNLDSVIGEAYWIGGKQDVNSDDVRWLNGHLVRPDWILNAGDSQDECLQYWPNENRLGMGSCEEKYHWICEKPDPSSLDMEININSVKENQHEQTVNMHQEQELSKSQQNQIVNVEPEYRRIQPQQPLDEQEQSNVQEHLTQEQQLQILEQQVQLELERQQNLYRQQLSSSQQQQQQTIPQLQDVIQKLTEDQLDAQKRIKLRQKQKQVTKVTGEPNIPGVQTVQVEQRPYEQGTRQEISQIETSARQNVSTTNKVSAGVTNQDVSTPNKVLVVGGNQGVSTTNKESVGEFQPLRYMCPPNFLRLGNSCYYFGSEMATWHQAHFACRDRDSQMITLETQWEDITIRHYLSKPEFARLNRWVGGIYNWSTKRWMWGPSGEVMPYLGFLTSEPPTSSRWHCVFMAPSLNYRWNHELCTSQMHYICESPQSKIPDSENIGYAQ